MTATLEVPTTDAAPVDSPAAASSGRHRLVAWGVSGLLYLGLSVAFWWRVWTTHPTTTTTCGCSDAARFLWFLRWPAFALTHGHNVFYSNYLFHPTGFNLLDDTSVIAIGVVLAPVTWLFGPVASMNVASTLIPVLSALAMFWLLRRWVAWTPAAFIGGLLYGFSPFIMGGLVAGWLTTLLAVPPLIVGCIDELCLRRRRRPVPVGIALGVLVAIQFFLSTEILAITALCVGLGFVLFAGYHLILHFDQVRLRAGRIAVGFGTGAGVSIVLLAYPVWFAFAGPAHLSGRIWPSVDPGYYGTTWSGFFRLSATAQVTAALHRYGGYQGSALHQPFYLGYGLAAVLIVGTLLWWRDRRLWLLAVLAVVTMSFCLTSFVLTNPGWVPWRVLGRVPVVQNILPVRFASMTYLAAAAMVGIIVDHARATVLGRPGRAASTRGTGPTSGAGRADDAASVDDGEPPVPAAPDVATGPTVPSAQRRGSGAHSPTRVRTRPPGPPRWRVLVAATVALAVAAVALVPVASSYRGNLPLTVTPVVLPDWFETVAPHLPPGQVLLTYPPPSGLESPMAWQAVGNMPYALVGGGGPYSVPERAGPERLGYNNITGATFTIDPGSAFLPSTVAAVRSAILGWGVTMVVIPDQPGRPAYDKGDHTAYVLAMMTVALGQPPVTVANAWTWRVGPHPPGPLVVSPAAFSACVGGANFPAGPPDTVPNCVLVASSAP